MDALVAQQDRTDIAGLKVLGGMTVGVVRGSAQEGEALMLQERFGLADIRKYDTVLPQLRMLPTERVLPGRTGARAAHRDLHGSGGASPRR